jgi:surface carbohydrate biosynthesis protein
MVDHKVHIKQAEPQRTNVTRFPIIYLPIEFQSREFDSKVLLSATLAQRGYTVVLGQQWLLYESISRLPPGVILFKGFNKFHQPAMAQARQSGYRVVILDEELLAQTEVKAVEALCTDGIFQWPDLILTDGQFEHDILKRLSTGRNRIEITGNGRIDLLKPALRPLFQKEIDEIVTRHGDFVLVNTNFSILNSIWQSVDQVTQIQLQAGFIKSNEPASMQMWQDYLDFEDANRTAMHIAMRELARRRPQQRIIVRPHPGEELKRWDGLFDEFPNVKVIREGAHFPWTMACRLLLHTSCTTGFEAQVAGKVALSLVPRPSWVASSLISNHVNPTFSDPLAMVSATEAILDGGPAPSPQPQATSPEQYVWNYAGNNATNRIADLLVEDLPRPASLTLTALQGAARDPRLKSKFEVSLRKCSDMLQRVRETCKIAGKMDVQELGESLFVVAPPAQITIEAPRMLDKTQIRAAMDTELRAGRFKNAYEIFKLNFGEAHRHSDLCFLAGVACFEQQEYRLALQYFQQATLPNSNVVNPDIAFMLARTHQKLGELETARRYAELAYDLVPAASNFFNLLKELLRQTGEKVPKQWLVIGCSHVRYFRYMQVNRPRFFGRSVHLECYEFAGATAFGLGNPESISGAQKGTRELHQQMANADRVIINFGEIDCRRAAWKAAETSGRTIDETVADSVAHLRAYVEREILPYSKKIILVGAKPQIIGDNDFYKNSLADERTIFKPLEERERVTLNFNRQLRDFAGKLKVDYIDLDDELRDEASRRKFFDQAFWDTYTDDTHGNTDYFARLYFERLRPFVT